MLTFLPLEQIDEMDKWEGSQLNQAKEILAFELTKLVHGEEEATKAQESARALFSAGSAADMPTTTLTEADLRDGSVDILGILVAAGLCPTPVSYTHLDVYKRQPLPLFKKMAVSFMAINRSFVYI